MKKTKILFWNTNKNENINHVIADIIAENQITVAILAEYAANLDKLLAELNDRSIIMQQYDTIGCNRIKIIGNQSCIVSGRRTDYTAFQIINNRYILCCLHLPSQIFKNNEGMRSIIIDRILTDIASTEKEFSSKKTIVVGDFNVNPFDYECLDATKFHSLPVYEDAKRGKRIIAGQEFKMFYNPMWNFFGDRNTPYGTYYYSGNGTSNSFWQIYDQVIIRPSLRGSFIDSSLKIITETETNFLLNSSGHPDKNISDHLPLTFEIEEDNYGKGT